ncbi:MAG: hypothetical protein LBH19_01555, partial [Dysgonamonadaceae bacterium]|nr:hypothetical protein [Dysgonamonadaceae bacterium]
RGDYQLPANVVGGAPYLIQLHTKETVLSFQSGEGRNTPETHTYANMQVYIGNDEAKDFSRKSTPFAWLPSNGQALWSSLCQTSDTTVMAVSAIGGLADQSGVWTSTGRIIKPLDVKPKTNAGWDNSASVFVGAMSPASMQAKALWNADSIYFRFDVQDAVQTTMPEGNDVWNSDGVEIFFDPRNRNSMVSDIYKFAVNINGETHFKRRNNNEWLDNPVEADINIERNTNSYSITMAIPVSGIGGTWSRYNTFGVHLKLHNNDNGAITHDELSGSHPDEPRTWLKATLLQPSDVKTQANNPLPINISGTKGGVKIDCAAAPCQAKVDVFSLFGSKVYNGYLTDNNGFLALSTGIYIVKIDALHTQKIEKVVVL